MAEIILLITFTATIINVYIIYRRYIKGLILSASLDLSMLVALKGMFGMSFDAGMMSALVGIFISGMLGVRPIEHVIRDKVKATYHKLSKPFHSTEWKNL